eukprot:2591338-Prymnesium_polylepis.1
MIIVEPKERLPSALLLRVCGGCFGPRRLPKVPAEPAESATELNLKPPLPAPPPCDRWYRSWHVYDNDGSFEGWFDEVPRFFRVGAFSPLATLFIVGFF